MFSLVLSFVFPGYTITLSGLLIVIFLSVFVPGNRSTAIAGIVSSLVKSHLSAAADKMQLR